MGLVVIMVRILTKDDRLDRVEWCMSGPVYGLSAGLTLL